MALGWLPAGLLAALVALDGLDGRDDRTPGRTTSVGARPLARWSRPFPTDADRRDASALSPAPFGQRSETGAVSSDACVDSGAGEAPSAASPASPDGLAALMIGSPEERCAEILSIDRNRLSNSRELRQTLERMAVGDPDVAQAAMLALLGDPSVETVSFLADVMRTDPGSAASIRAAQALAEHADPAIAHDFMSLALDPHADIRLRRCAVRGLGAQELSADVIAVLLHVESQDPDRTLRTLAVHALYPFARNDTVAGELRLMIGRHDIDDAHRATIATVLHHAGQLDLDALTSLNQDLRSASLEALVEELRVDMTR